MDDLMVIASHATDWVAYLPLVFLMLIVLFAVEETHHRLRAASRLFRRHWRHHEFKKLLPTLVLMAASIGPAGYYGSELVQYFLGT